MTAPRSLFGDWQKPPQPLAEALRPQSLNDVVGHTRLLAPEGWLRTVVDSGEPPHMIFWGPPGVGKTTLATCIARSLDAHFEHHSAVLTGVPAVRQLLQDAAASYGRTGRKTVFFLDEIHRFNKAQQDVLLSDLERGTVVLIGATTENPAFSLNNALLSRVQVLTLEPLTEAEIGQLVERAATRAELDLDATAQASIVQAASGDGRFAINLVATAAQLKQRGALSAADIEMLLADNPLRHDRQGDQHYDIVSAWIKTMRGSDVDAALYWSARLWEAGEDPRFLFRRLIIFAAEDVGNADPQALQLAVAAANGFDRVGQAEGWILFAQVVSYLATAVKSNRSYLAYQRARDSLQQYGQAPVPKHLRNAPTHLAKAAGHGEGYVYPHDQPNGFAAEIDYFPEGMPRQTFYQPSDRGAEHAIAARTQARRQQQRQRDKSSS